MSPMVGPEERNSENPKMVDHLEVTEIEDGLIIYQESTDRVHYLNSTASVVLQLCNGSRTVEEIVTSVERLFDLDDAPAAEVGDCLARLEREGLVR